MKRSLLTRCGALTVMLMVSMVLGAFGAKVVWQSIPNSSHVTASGEPFGDDVSFELGTFAAGFTPTLGNREQWASKWTVIDRTTYNSETKFFASNVSFESNAAPYVAGRKVYMWGSTGGASPEWVLATSGEWLWPEASLSLPTVWNIVTATNVITGQINASGSPYLLRTNSSGGAAGGSMSPHQWLAPHVHDESRRQRSASADQDRCDVLGAVFSSQRRIPDLRDQQARLRQFRTLPCRCRG